MLHERVYDLRSEKQTRGRKPGQAASNSQYRKGISGDSVHHFTPAHAEYFNEKFGDLLLVTGSETELWTVERPETKWRASLTPSQ